jgi:pyridoxine 5'-phosphate synthase PdxJ
MKRRKVRPEKIINAVKWLKENNKHWKNIDLDDIKHQACSVKPVFIDMSHEVQSENANIKQREMFTCYFPNRTTTNHSGSYNGNVQAAFKQKVKDLKEIGFEFELKVDIESKFVNEAALDEFVNACLLQFLYGVGGINDKREKPDGTFVSCQSIAEYL